MKRYSISGNFGGLKIRVNFGEFSRICQICFSITVIREPGAGRQN